MSFCFTEYPACITTVKYPGSFPPALGTVTVSSVDPGRSDP